jgi:hypothetical protein
MTNGDKENFLEKNQNQCTSRGGLELTIFLLKHHNIFSQDKNDIGLATNLKHRIDLKEKEPTYRN